MKRKITVATILTFGLILSSCNIEHRDLEWVCSCEQQQKAADFVTANMKAANNMSDEEMEDVIEELTKTSIMLNCSQRLMFQDRNGVDWRKEKLNDCETLIEY